MDSIEFIRVNIARAVVGGHSLSKEIARKAAEEIIERYKRGDFHDLTELIGETINGVRVDTGMVEALSSKVTATRAAEILGCCTPVARKRLAAFKHTVIDKTSRPYIYSLLNK